MGLQLALFRFMVQTNQTTPCVIKELSKIPTTTKALLSMCVKKISRVFMGSWHRRSVELSSVIKPLLKMPTATKALSDMCQKESVVLRWVFSWVCGRKVYKTTSENAHNPYESLVCPWAPPKYFKNMTESNVFLKCTEKGKLHIAGRTRNTVNKLIGKKMTLSTSISRSLFRCMPPTFSIVICFLFFLWFVVFPFQYTQGKHGLSDDL